LRVPPICELSLDLISWLTGDAPSGVSTYPEQMLKAHGGTLNERK